VWETGGKAQLVINLGIIRGVSGLFHAEIALSPKKGNLGKHWI
jgi:hypothetical protein